VYMRVCVRVCMCICVHVCVRVPIRMQVSKHPFLYCTTLATPAQLLVAGSVYSAVSPALGWPSGNL